MREAEADRDIADQIAVIAFDVFGTVVDWHGGIAAEVERIAPGTDGDAFARAWREGYKPAMQKVMGALAAGHGGFVKIDRLHRTILDTVLPRFGLSTLTEVERQQLNLAWHRLPAWSDSVRGLTRLKSRYRICTLSNGNLGLLADMAKHAGLPWDLILSAETFSAYKPDPRTYLGVADVFDVAPAQLMLAAAHQDDLDAARGCGLATAYIERPFEFGRTHLKAVAPDSRNTLHATDIDALASRLGCA